MAATLAHMNGVYVAHGMDGIVTFDGASVTIERRGVLSVGHRARNKRIQADAITGLEFQYGGLTGSIRFLYPGSDQDLTVWNGSQYFENEVQYRRKYKSEFDQLRDAIQWHVDNRGHSSQPQYGGSAADRLAELNRMYQQLLISPEEYEWKRQEILGQI